MFHFEGKIWRTLPMLAFQPGELTRRYIAGERARFVSPLALFLFSVFLMFAVVANRCPAGSFGDCDFLKPGVAARPDAGADQTGRGTRARRQPSVKALQARIARERAKADPDAERIASRTERLARAQKAADDLARAENALPNDKTNFDIVSAPGSPGGNWLEAEIAARQGEPAAAALQD